MFLIGFVNILFIKMFLDIIKFVLFFFIYFLFYCVFMLYFRLIESFNLEGFFRVINFNILMVLVIEIILVCLGEISLFFY